MVDCTLFACGDVVNKLHPTGWGDEQSERGKGARRGSLFVLPIHKNAALTVIGQ